MKKALLLTGIFLCSASVFAENRPTNLIADGKKRNEEAYERMLEQTGWKNETSTRLEKDPQPAHESPAGSSQPKSS
jgi:hypothetical protein